MEIKIIAPPLFSTETGGNTCPTEEQELDRIMHAIERFGDKCSCEAVMIKVIKRTDGVIEYVYTLSSMHMCPEHGTQSTFVIEYGIE